MIKTTVKELKRLFAEKHHAGLRVPPQYTIYAFKLNTLYIYIGFSTCISTRLFEHILNCDRFGCRKTSMIGNAIETHNPDSDSWDVLLYTPEEVICLLTGKFKLDPLYHSVKDGRFVEELFIQTVGTVLNTTHNIYPKHWNCPKYIAREASNHIDDSPTNYLTKKNGD